MILPYCVYMVRCYNGRYYTGFTRNLKKRLAAHSKGEVHYTKDKLPVTLVYCSYFRNFKKAYDFERYLKSGSGKAFMNNGLV